MTRHIRRITNDVTNRIIDLLTRDRGADGFAPAAGGAVSHSPAEHVVAISGALDKTYVPVGGFVFRVRPDARSDLRTKPMAP